MCSINCTRLGIDLNARAFCCLCVKGVIRLPRKNTYSDLKSVAKQLTYHLSKNKDSPKNQDSRNIW